MRVNPHTGELLRNYWGYDPLCFPCSESIVRHGAGRRAQVLEFKEMIRSFHSAGIEVILDVVFNHTVESDELGPTVCFRGIDNPIYYWLEEDKRFYRDFAGTGKPSTRRIPVVRDLILDALRYWVMEMHVDGFRFDLASVLGPRPRWPRDGGCPAAGTIAEDPILARHKADRGSLGCRAALIRWERFSDGALGGVERPFSR